MDSRIDRVYNILRVTFGLLPIVAGVDKFTNLLTDWADYLSPAAVQVLPFSAQIFMYLVGIIEIAAGILVLVKPRIGAYVVCAWLVAISLNLIARGLFDVAVRDLVMAVAAFCLGRLAEVRVRAEAGEPATARATRVHA